MIEGVKVTELISYPDERGFFREVIRFDDFGFAPKQESHAFRVAGVANGWHIHRFHRETFYVVRGSLRLSLKDCRHGRKESVAYPYGNEDGLLVTNVDFGLSSTPNEYMEFILSEYAPRVVSVPAGVAHGFFVLQNADIIYTATDTYETARLDEGRILPRRWPRHDWARGIEVK